LGLGAGSLGLRVDLPAVYEVGDGEWHGAWVVYRACIAYVRGTRTGRKGKNQER
jgi:hypothetical protein